MAETLPEDAVVLNPAVTVMEGQSPGLWGKRAEMGITKMPATEWK